MDYLYFPLISHHRILPIIQSHRPSKQKIDRIQTTYNSLVHRDRKASIFIVNHHSAANIFHSEKSSKNSFRKFWLLRKKAVTLQRGSITLKKTKKHMPEIVRFYGIVIKMFFKPKEHEPSHML